MLLLEVDGLVSGAIAIGYEMDEGVEDKMSNNMQIGNVLWQKRSVPGNHARTLLCNIIGNEELLRISLIDIDDPVKRVIVDVYSLFLAESDWPSLLHVVHFSETLEHLRRR